MKTYTVKVYQTDAQLNYIDHTLEGEPMPLYTLTFRADDHDVQGMFELAISDLKPPESIFCRGYIATLHNDMGEEIACVPERY